MTTEDFEKIALWMGWRRGLNPDFWVSFDGEVSHGAVHTRTSLTDSEAVEALDKVSKEVKLKYMLEGHPDNDQHHCSIADLDADPFMFFNSDWQSTIHKAVEAALTAMLQQED